MSGPALVLQLRQSQLVGDLFQQWQFALVTTELVLLVAQCIRVTGSPGVFQVGAEGGVGQARAAVELVVFQLGEHTKALCVALEIEEITALRFVHIIQPATPCGLLEPVADGVLA